MTTKERMSEYLLRLQQWQRMCLGIARMNIVVDSENGGAVINVCVNMQCFMLIEESVSKKENDIRMKFICDYLHKTKVI